MREFWYASPVGWLRIQFQGTALFGLHFTDGQPDISPAIDRSARSTSVSDPIECSGFNALASQLDEYFAGQRKHFDFDRFSLQLDGTLFQRRVWQELTRIPYGQTLSYGELARRIGAPSASRAVGLANGRNPISIVVPCHRVIGASGRLVGYGGGLDRKRRLLELEGCIVKHELFEAVS